MHSLFFTPRKGVQQDDHWGQSVVSLVNSALGLDMEYFSPEPLTCKCLGVAETSHAQDANLDVSDSSYHRLNGPQHRPGTQIRQADVLFSRVDQRPQYFSETSHVRFNSEQRNLETLHEREGWAADAHRGGQHSSNSLRLPEFFRRVFAPPICLQPDIDNYDYSNRLWNARPRATPSHPFQVYGDHAPCRQPSNSYPRTKIRTSRPLVPWASTNSVGKARSLPTSQETHWSGIEKWKLGMMSQEDDPIRGSDKAHESTIVAGHRNMLIHEKDVLNEPSNHALSLNSECSSVYSYCEDSHNSVPTAPRAQAGALSTADSQTKIDLEIQAFLNSPLEVQPLNAEQILQLCEAAELVESECSKRILEQTIRQQKQASCAEHRSKTPFQPRMTIGKTKV